MSRRNETQTRLAASDVVTIKECILLKRRELTDRLNTVPLYLTAMKAELQRHLKRLHATEQKLDQIFKENL